MTPTLCDRIVDKTCDIAAFVLLILAFTMAYCVVCPPDPPRHVAYVVQTDDLVMWVAK